MSELPVTIEGYLADVRGIDTWGAGSIMALAEIIIVGTSEAQGVVPAAQVAAPASVPVAATATVKVATVGSTALRGEGTLATVKVATSGTATVEFSGDGATNRKGFPYHFPIVFGADNFRMWTSGPADAGITSTANAGVALIASMWSRIEASAGVVVSVDANADIVFEAPQWSSGVFPFTFPIKFLPEADRLHRTRHHSSERCFPCKCRC